MKVRNSPHFRPYRNCSRLLTLVLSAIALPLLTGCYSVRTRSVMRTVLAPHILDATVEQLKQRLEMQYNAIQTINASVDIAASTGGEHEGKVKEIPTLAGYIFLRKPADLRMLLLVPVFRSRALDMVSNGDQFKLLISAPKVRAVEGADVMTVSSKNGLENLRPTIIRDALLIPPVMPEEYVTLTEGSRILPALAGTKETIEEPDYDLRVQHTKSDHELELVRVIHFGRITLQPYEQDIYDHKGRIVTIVKYDKYQKSGEVGFPMSILITRPLDEYKLQINFTKLMLDQKLADDEFVLNFPEGIPVQKM